MLPFAKKIFVSYKDLEGVPKRYQDKVVEIGNIIRKDLIYLSSNYLEKGEGKKINILILGGSQAAKVFAEKLPDIFLKCKYEGLNINIFQHCMPNQNESLNQ